MMAGRMVKVTVIEEFNAPAEQIWDIVGGFNSLSVWHPAVDKSELQEGGAIRKLLLQNGDEAFEELVNHSDELREYSYSIVKSSLPIVEYFSTLKIFARGTGSRVEWSGEFHSFGVPDDEASELIKGIYQAGLDNLKSIVNP